MDGFNQFMAGVKAFFESGLGTAILFIFTAIVGFIVIKLVLKLLKRLEARGKTDKTVFKFIRNICKFLLYMLYVITLLAIIGVPITSLVAIITALTLGVTLALQNTVSNIVNGIILMANKPYKLGDKIEVSGVTGEVIDINMFNTKLQTVTNEIITIPHNITLNNTVTDLTAMDKRKVVITIGVDYKADVSFVKAVLSKVVETNNYVLHDQEYNVHLSAMNASSIDFTIKAWAKVDEYYDCMYALNEELFAALGDNDINIPYQTIDVNIKDHSDLKPVSKKYSIDNIKIRPGTAKVDKPTPPVEEESNILGIKLNIGAKSKKTYTVSKDQEEKSESKKAKAVKQNSSKNNKQVKTGKKKSK